MNRLPHRGLRALACLLLLAAAPPAAAQEELPDSLLTEDYLYEYTFTDFGRARRIIEKMRERKTLEPHRLDIAEGNLYFNTGRYRQGLRYYDRALASDAVQRDDDEYMEVLHRMISAYDCLHKDAEQARCTELLLAKARAAGSDAMESVALFNMGKMRCYQHDTERGFALMRDAIARMRSSDYKYKYDNLRYDYHTLLVLLQRDGRAAEALAVLDELERIVADTQEGLPSVGGLREKELKTLLAQRAVLFGRLGRYDEADSAYRAWERIGGAYTKDDYLVIPYLMQRRRYDEAIGRCEPRERFLVEQGDTINYHMMTLKRMLGTAHEARGDYRRAAASFRALAVLTDSLKRREQQSAAMDLAIAYDVHEKERQLSAKETQLRIRNLLLASALAIVLLLVALLWRSLCHMRTVRRKNRVLVANVAGMLAYKERLLHSAGADSAPGDVGTAGAECGGPGGGDSVVEAAAEAAAAGKSEGGGRRPTAGRRSFSSSSTARSTSNGCSSTRGSHAKTSCG